MDALGGADSSPIAVTKGDQSAVHFEWTIQDTLEVVATLYMLVPTCSVGVAADECLHRMVQEMETVQSIAEDYHF